MNAWGLLCHKQATGQLTRLGRHAWSGILSTAGSLRADLFPSVGSVWGVGLIFSPTAPVQSHRLSVKLQHRGDADRPPSTPRTMSYPLFAD